MVSGSPGAWLRCGKIYKQGLWRCVPYASARRGEPKKKTEIKSGFHFRARAPDPLLRQQEPSVLAVRNTPGAEYSGAIRSGTRAVGGQESENRAKDSSSLRSLRLAACPGEAYPSTF